MAPLGGRNREFDARPKTDTRGTRMLCRSRTDLRLNPALHRRDAYTPVAQLENNSADFYVFSIERQKTMSAHPSRRAQEHRLPACVWTERSLRWGFWPERRKKIVNNLLKRGQQPARQPILTSHATTDEDAAFGPKLLCGLCYSKAPIDKRASCQSHRCGHQL